MQASQDLGVHTFQLHDWMKEVLGRTREITSNVVYRDSRSVRSNGTTPSPANQCRNGLVESVNGRPRDECLNEYLFGILNEARRIIEEWRIDYNTNRPHTSPNGLTPNEFAARPDQEQSWNRCSL